MKPILIALACVLAFNLIVFGPQRTIAAITFSLERHLFWRTFK